MSRYQSRDELEEGITLLVKEDRLIDEEINERRLGIFFWILVIVGFSGFVAFFGWDRKVVQIITKYFGSRSSTTTTDLYIQASNKYGTFSAPYPWLDSTPGTQLVEPFITSKLTVTGAFASGSTYQWTLDYPSSSDGMEWSGTSTVQEVTLTVPGSYSLSLEAFDAKTGSFRGRYTTLVVCKYVKRELRALSDDDRARLWDASLYMWNTSTSAGRARFGSDFTSIATFASAYMAATGAYRCDSYHDGSAWITHHLALSNAFEASLRAVGALRPTPLTFATSPPHFSFPSNHHLMHIYPPPPVPPDPSLSLPYWDFTIEGQVRPLLLPSLRPPFTYRNQRLTLLRIPTHTDTHALPPPPRRKSPTPPSRPHTCCKSRPSSPRHTSAPPTPPPPAS